MEKQKLVEEFKTGYKFYLNERVNTNKPKLKIPKNLIELYKVLHELHNSDSGSLRSLLELTGIKSTTEAVELLRCLS